MAIPLVSTDPSDIANAARCFASCVPIGEQTALRTYLLNQVGQITGPPCTTPATPGNVRALASTSTTITIGWKQAHNSGSLITGWQVFWGTASGGPYPNTSGVIPASPSIYTITGLTPGTTYFFVVQAVAFAGCVSVNSNQGSGTTSGGLGLLATLSHYYKFDDGGPIGLTANPPLHDAVGSADIQNLAGTNDATNVVGLINQAVHFSGGTGTVYFGISNTTLSTLFASAATPLTIQVWVKLDAAQVSAVTGFIGANSTVANSSYYSLRFTNATGKFTWRYFDTTNAAVDLTYSVAPSTLAWHQIVIGVDVANGQTFMYLDGANKQTANIPNGPKAPGTTTTFIVFNELPVIGDPAAAMDEIGIWNSLLTQTQITALYNGGAGLPLSSFT